MIQGRGEVSKISTLCPSNFGQESQRFDIVLLMLLMKLLMTIKTLQLEN